VLSAVFPFTLFFGCFLLLCYWFCTLLAFIIFKTFVCLSYQVEWGFCWLFGCFFRLFFFFFGGLGVGRGLGGRVNYSRLELRQGSGGFGDWFDATVIFF